MQHYFNSVSIITYNTYNFNRFSGKIFHNLLPANLDTCCIKSYHSAESVSNGRCVFLSSAVLLKLRKHYGCLGVVDVNINIVFIENIPAV